MLSHPLVIWPNTWFLEISQFFPSSHQYYSYFPETSSGLTTFLTDFHSYLTSSETPFDGVLGFSQGANLAASYIASHPHDHPFKCAMFICGGIPDNLKGVYFTPEEQARLFGVSSGQGGGGEQTPVIKIPTAHVLGKRDPGYEVGLELVNMCEKSMRSVYVHEGSHEIPKGQVGTKRLVECVEEIVGRALLLQ